MCIYLCRQTWGGVPVVFVVGLDELDGTLSRRVEELRLLYVGMTRATHRLFLSAMDTSKIVDLVE